MAKNGHKEMLKIIIGQKLPTSQNGEKDKIGQIWTKMTIKKWPKWSNGTKN